MRFLKTKISFILILILAGCTTFYQRFHQFNSNFEQGKLLEAERVLSDNKKAKKSKAKLLYHMNLGVVKSMLGKYEESNQHLEQAYYLGEDYSKNYLNEAVSMVTNPNLVDYKGEDFELLFIHYYKALNFLKLNDKDAALVECRRMNIKLNQLNDKYKSETKFKRDAFVHNLMGIIYDASGDYNNAFIAYRNALEIYKQDYTRLFNIEVPMQLKLDLLRCSHKMGFMDELRRYEQDFGINFQPDNVDQGELVFFWHNGLGPVKSEWGINFAAVKGAGALVNFTSEEYNMTFPFYLNDEKEYEEKGLSKLHVVRVVFPKYIERKTFFNEAAIEWSGGKVPLYLAEDINAIAFKSLEQRMLLELSKSLLRVALKKAAELQVRKSNDELGAVLGIVNAFTEKADTRNWQTVPHSIYYTRIKLNEGEQTLNLKLSGTNSKNGQNHQLKFNIKRGETLFHTFHSLEQQNLQYFTNYN